MVTIKIYMYSNFRIEVEIYSRRNNLSILIQLYHYILLSFIILCSLSDFY